MYNKYVKSRNQWAHICPEEGKNNNINKVCSMDRLSTWKRKMGLKEILDTGCNRPICGEFITSTDSDKVISWEGMSK